jgi:hypothetical protein
MGMVELTRLYGPTTKLGSPADIYTGNNILWYQEPQII